MTLEQARAILNLLPEDDELIIKAKYRKLMLKHHPDAAGSDHPDHIQRAQEINEAYRLAKKHIGTRTKKKYVWKGELNPKAYAKRTIYMPYSADVEVRNLFQKITKGKYYWNPEEEEFPCFMQSLNHASLDILNQVEMPDSLSGDELGKICFPFQVKLIKLLAEQFVNPLSSLEHILDCEKNKTDLCGEAAKIYNLQAYLGEVGNQAVQRNIALLKEKDLILPKALQNNRVLVMDKLGNNLGSLSFKDDALYFCLIPLFREKLAQVKMSVEEVQKKKKGRAFQYLAKVRMLVRIPENVVYVDKTEQANELIKEVLREFEKENGV